MAEISKNIIKDGRKLNQFHGKLRKSNPIYKCLDHTYNMKAGSLSDIGNNSMRFKWYLQQWQKIYVISMVMAACTTPSILWTLRWDLQKWQEILSNYYTDDGTLCDGRRLCIEQLLQWWQNTLWQQRTLQQSKSGPSIVHLYVTILFNHTNPFTFFAVNDYNITTAGVKQGANNSFTTTNNYSGIPTQHIKTGEWHCSSNSFQTTNGSMEVDT